MTAVWKFEVPVDDSVHTLTMPAPARVVHVGCQRPGVVAVWAEVGAGSQDTAERGFRVYGTGQEVSGSYVGTAHDDGLVWHVYAEPARLAL